MSTSPHHGRNRMCRRGRPRTRRRSFPARNACRHGRHDCGRCRRGKRHTGVRSNRRSKFTSGHDGFPAAFRGAHRNSGDQSGAGVRPKKATFGFRSWRRSDQHQEGLFQLDQCQRRRDVRKIAADCQGPPPSATDIIAAVNAGDDTKFLARSIVLLWFLGSWYKPEDLKKAAPAGDLSPPRSFRRRPTPRAWFGKSRRPTRWATATCSLVIGRGSPSIQMTRVLLSASSHPTIP